MEPLAGARGHVVADLGDIIEGFAPQWSPSPERGVTKRGRPAGRIREFEPQWSPSPERGVTWQASALASTAPSRNGAPRRSEGSPFGNGRSHGIEAEPQWSPSPERGVTRSRPWTGRRARRRRNGAPRRSEGSHPRSRWTPARPSGRNGAPRRSEGSPHSSCADTSPLTPPQWSPSPERGVTAEPEWGSPAKGSEAFRETSRRGTQDPTLFRCQHGVIAATGHARGPRGLPWRLRSRIR